MSFRGVITFIIIFIALTIPVVVFGLSTQEIQKANMESYLEKCKEIGLEYLSVTKQVFGDDYIICFDNENKQTSEIPI